MKRSKCPNLTTYMYISICICMVRLFCGSWELGVLFTPSSLSLRNISTSFSCADVVPSSIPFFLSKGSQRAGDEGTDEPTELVTTQHAGSNGDGSSAVRVSMPIPYELPPIPYEPGIEPWHSDGLYEDRPDAYGFKSSSEGESTVGSKYNRVACGKERSTYEAQKGAAEARGHASCGGFI